ncbi:hypothetical protein C1645_880296 [Glomus cerebriforme]|uniref:General transcription and DNA repair factor IIH subunit TFB5 n=1 Tax=Glomus cerebriforme TaxID=658196 RepID=A0A397SIL2_9GLOM|nr:hypothetical protein C1645_880296 [Glomus cerebriforme]
MVRAVVGTHIKCFDKAIKQVLLLLNEKMNFIIEEDGLDIIIKRDQFEEVKKELERILEENQQATNVIAKATDDY